MSAQHTSGAAVINATGGWTAVGAGLICEEAREAMAAAGRESVFIAEFHDRNGWEIAAAFNVEAACVVSCAAAALAVTAAAALVRFGGADPVQLPTRGPRRRRVLLPKGHALNFSAEITQMLRLSGAEPVEVGAVNACPRAAVERACKDPDVVCAYYVQSAEAFPYGTLELGEFVDVCHEHGLIVIVDASAQPLTEPIRQSGADVIIQSPHKMMGSPTAGLILGDAGFIAECRALEGSFGRPFKTSKETLAGVAAAVTAWTRVAERTVLEGWEERAELAADHFDRIPGLTFESFHYPPPLQGVHARLTIEPLAFGMDARTLAAALKTGTPRIAVIEEELSQGSIIMHFAMLDEPAISTMAERVRALQRS